MYSYLDTPLDPTGDYTEQEKELERQRQLALALYKNVIGGANANAQATGPYNGLAAFLGQALGGIGAQKSESDFAAKQAEIDRNKAAAERKFYASIPQGTPGQPGGDLAADGMGPPTPTILPKPPSMQQYADWAGSAPQTPVAQKLAAQTMERFLPMSPDLAYQKETDRDIKRTALRQSEEAANQRYEVALQNARTAEDKAAADERYKNDLLDLRRQLATQQVAGKMAPSEGSSVDGNPLMRNTITGTQHEVINGIPSQEPYAGPIISKAEQKNVGEVSSILNDARMARDLADKVHDKPQVFSTRANVMNTVSGLAGGLGRESMTGLSPEDLQLRGVVMRDFAATTKQLYGASFTQSEQARANSFVPQSNDSAAVIEQKLRGAAEFNEEMAQKYGGKILGAAQARTGAGNAPLQDNFAPGTDAPGMADYFAQQEKAGKVKNFMLPQPIGGKTVVRTGRTPDGLRAVQYSDGTVEIQ